MSGYHIESVVHHGPWGEYDGTSYFVISPKGETVAKCDSFESACTVRDALNIQQEAQRKCLHGLTPPETCDSEECKQRWPKYKPVRRDSGW